MEKDIEWRSLTILILILFIASIYVMRPVLDALLLAVFFVYMASPLADRIEGVVKNRGIAAILVVALAILPVLLVGLQLLEIYANELTKLENLRYSMPIFGEVGFDGIYSEVMREVKARLGPEQVLKGLGMGMEFIFKVFVFFAGSYYLLREKFALRRFLVSLAPASREAMVAHFIETVDRTYYGVFFGHFITSIAIGLIAMVGFFLIGRFMGIAPLQNYPLLLGLLTAILAILPIVGPKLVYVPISAVLFLLGDLMGAVAVLSFGLVGLTLIPDMVIRPIVAGRHGNTHPFIVLLGFITGPMVFGPLGVLLGPGILGLLKATLDTYREFIMEERA